MSAPQAPRAGILPATSPIVSAGSMPHIPIASTDPNTIESETTLQPDQSGAGQVPTISPERQELSGALLKLAGTFLGNALEEGVGDKSGRTANAIQQFAETGAGLMKERWFKENASNFNNMVFKPYEKATQAAFQDYNQQLDQIMADPNIQPEEKFAAARALQYKLSMTGKNLSLQVQMAAANPQFSSNPYVKNTITTLLDHQVGVIDQLAQSHKVALDDEKAIADIQANKSAVGANQAIQTRQEAETQGIVEKNRIEAATGQRMQESIIDKNRAEAAHYSGASGENEQKRVAAGDFSLLPPTDEGARRALAAASANANEIATRVKPVVEQRTAEVIKEKEKAGEEFQLGLETEFKTWADKNNIVLTDPIKIAEAKEAFFASKPEPGTALELYKKSPNAKRAYLAYLQHAGSSDALAPVFDIGQRLKGKPTLWDADVAEAVKANTRGINEQVVFDEAVRSAKASNNEKLAEILINSPANPDWVNPEDVKQELSTVVASIHEAQQHLDAAIAAKDKKSVEMIKAAVARAKARSEQLTAWLKENQGQ